MPQPSDREIEIFNAALELPAAERGAYLDQTCADDAALRLRVEELLQAGEQAGDFLESAAAVSSGPGRTIRPAIFPAEKPGDRIGRYKLLQQIGEGGCGVVYMAEQEEPVRRRVALKVIKLGMDTRSVIARFEAERQALALMDHPNISKVFDAGATETGRPYFVMELVRGIKITDFCDENNISTQDRLRLFIQVCQAIQHAHQKGVIHRDIKPSNILVTINDVVPVPKVIDFGIAKATQGRLTDHTLFTAFEQFIGTPAYMSPEQALMTNMDIDTRSDIYSLGVLLYELLTGRTPFDQKELLAAGLDEMRRTICEKEPPKPSTRLTQELAATDVRRLQSKSDVRKPKSEEEIRASSRRLLHMKEQIHLLRGDLDWIAMKCLEKDRARRYETANGLAMDIERHLRDEPVIARPASRLYEFQKTVRRHKFGFAATAAVLVALAGGVVVSTLEAIRTTQAVREQIRLRGAAQQAQANEATLRQKAEADQKKAEAEAAKSRQVAQLLEGMLDIDRSAALGRDTTVLQEILAKAADRFDRELNDQPEVQAELLFIIGRTYFDLGRYLEAEAMDRKALATYQKQPFGPEHPQAADVCAHLAATLGFEVDQEKLPEAESLAREALRLWRALPGDHTKEMAHSVNDIANQLHRQSQSTQDPDSRRRLLGEAESMAREARGLLQKSASESLEFSSSLRTLAVIIADRGRLSEAESLQRDALAIEMRLTGEESLTAAASELTLGDILSSKGKERDAETLLRKGLTLRRKLLGNDHDEVGFAWAHLAICLQRQGRLQEAEPAVREALRIRLNGLRPAHPWTLETLDQLANVLRDEGKLNESEVSFRDLLALRRKVLGDDHPDVRASLESLVNVLLLQHKYPEAEQVYGEMIGIQSGSAALLRERGGLRARLGHFTEAASDLARVIQLRPEENDAWFWLAAILAKQARYEAYREHCRKSLERFAKTSDPVIAERTAKECLILSESGADLETITSMVDLALGTGTNHWAITWFQCTKGLAEYRRGRFSSAAEWAQKALFHAGDILERDAQAYLVLAMAQYRSKQTDEASAAFAKGVDIAESKLPKLDSGDLGGDWKDWIIAHLLLREAGELIAGPAANVTEKKSEPH